MDSACTVCGSRSKREPWYYVWQGKRFWMRRCRSCTHQFVFPQVTVEEQAAMYADPYFQADGDWSAGYFGAYEDAEAELRKEAQDVLAMLPVSSGSLLDIGCAGGVFLDSARQAGFEVTGLEINERMVSHARETYGLDVTCSRIEDAGAPEWNGRFDVVTLMDVLEHLPEPRQALAKVARWTKPGGVIFIRGPFHNGRKGLAKDWIRRLVGYPFRIPGYPLDANIFNRRSMTRLLRVTGYGNPHIVKESVGCVNLTASRSTRGAPLVLRPG